MITEVKLLKTILDDPASVDRPVKELADRTYAMVTADTPVSQLSRILSEGCVAIAEENHHPSAVITQIDLLDYLAHRTG